MRLLIITSCAGPKSTSLAYRLTLASFQQVAARFLKKDKRIQSFAIRAVDQVSLHNHSAFAEVADSQGQGRNLE